MGVLFKNADITVYNKYYDAANDVDKYQRTVTKGVNWQGKKHATVTDKGLLLADSTLIFIDKLDNYVSPKKFNKLSDLESEFDDVVNIKSVNILTDHIEVEGV